jgi:hypothetical protein
MIRKYGVRDGGEFNPGVVLGELEGWTEEAFGA